VNPKLNQAERTLYDSDKFASSIYRAINNAPDREVGRILFNLLRDEQKEQVRAVWRIKREAQ
jgi:hypothetical protein